MGRNLLWFVAICVGTCAIFVFSWMRGCEHRVPPSEFAESWLRSRPQEVDVRLVERFELLMDGQPVVGSHAKVIQGNPTHFAGEFSLKSGTLDVRQSFALTMGHRLIVNGQADWTPLTDGFDEVMITPAYPDTDIDTARVLHWGPADYEVRFFLLIKNDDVTVRPDIHLIASGKVTVIPADGVAERSRNE